MKILYNKYRTIITSLILVVTPMIFILPFLSLTSCRSADIDQDNVLNGSERSGGIAAVNINLLGAEYANSNKPAQVASINNKGLNVDNDVQHYSALVSPSSFITAELTPNRSLSSVASSKNLNTLLLSQVISWVQVISLGLLLTGKVTELIKHIRTILLASQHYL